MEQSEEQTPEMAMRYKHDTKQMPCKYCGIAMTVGIRTKKQPNHVECGVQESIKTAFELHNHSGPRYEKWVKAQVRAAERLARGTLPPE